MHRWPVSHMWHMEHDDLPVITAATFLHTVPDPVDTAEGL